MPYSFRRVVPSRKSPWSESCVIVGRCANWVLRNDKNSFHVFVCSNITDAVKRVTGYINADSETAKLQIEKINKARTNHYWQYTGGSWTDARNYDLVVNSSRISIDEIVKSSPKVFTMMLHRNQRQGQNSEPTSLRYVGRRIFCSGDFQTQVGRIEE